jgi:hypothetical protein
MNGRDRVLGISRKIVEAQFSGALHQPINRERPRLAIEMRNPEVTEHDHILRRRQPRNHLMWQKRDAAKKPGGLHADAICRNSCGSHGGLHRSVDRKEQGETQRTGGKNLVLRATPR